MKVLRVAIALLVVLFAVVAMAQSDASSSFEKLKGLQGTWTGKSDQGEALQVVFRNTSNGSAIMSEIVGQEDMISMFHMDGSRLLLTHYCAAGNQPRMQATVSADGKTFTFDFVDGTNLSATSGHMQQMVLTMLDENHHSEDWTFVQAGKKIRKHFDLERKG